MHMRNAFLITKRTIQGNGRFSSDVFRMKPKSFHSNEKNMHFSTTTMASGSTIVDFAHKGIIHFGYVDEQYSTNEIGVVTSRGERISVSRQRLLFQKELTSQERLHPHMLTDLYQTSLGHILPLYDQAEVLWKESIHEKFITVDKAANLLFKRPPTITQIYGAHRLLLDQTVYFKRQRDGTYYCHTPASVEQAYLHLFSLRKKQVHLASFLARAAHQLVRKRPEVYKDDPVILNLQSAASLNHSLPKSKHQWDPEADSIFISSLVEYASADWDVAPPNRFIYDKIVRPFNAGPGPEDAQRLCKDLGLSLD